MSSIGDSDVQLIGRVAGGDQEAFAHLFDHHSSVVLGFLTRMLGDRSEAEEVLQEVFLQVWDQASRYKATRATPRGWMMMMARSRALDRIRSRDARSRREKIVAEEKGQEENPVGTARLEQGERGEMIDRALSTLPDEQRLCVELAFFEGLSQSQISRRLDVPLGTVKSRFQFGMKKLRTLLAS